MITIIKLYSRELFHSNVVLFTCISMYSLYKGFSSPETYWENKTHKLKRKRSINFETSHFSSIPFLEYMLTMTMVLALWHAALTDS